MKPLRIAAFSHNNTGGNPAGIVICDKMPPESEMLALAREVGYSETVFLVRVEGGWRARYFAPEIEVPFCGHATIAAGAALGERFGEGTYTFILNQGSIPVDVGKSDSGGYVATLTSPGTWSTPAPDGYIEEVLSVFSFKREQLDPDFPIYLAFAGAKHLIVFLKNRQDLSDMAYDMELLTPLMRKEEITTVNLLWRESDRRFHARNPFPVGGVYEDPATGAAAAALGGYLRDIGWSEGKGRIEILQGADMGLPSRLSVEIPPTKGEGVRVSGETRYIPDKRKSV